jgi:hypothetical protein
MNFSRNSTDFRELLKPRSSRGVHDLLIPNFIPG